VSGQGGMLFVLTEWESGLIVWGAVQLGRSSVFGTEGWGFDSLRVRSILPGVSAISPGLLKPIRTKLTLPRVASLETDARLEMGADLEVPGI
jgi:hypothetical protein